PPDPGQGRGPDPLRQATGLRHLPSRNYQASTAWCQAASTACDLLAWLRLPWPPPPALDGALAKAEPKTLRYKILHAAGRIVKGQRRRYLRIPAAWPRARDITDAFTPIMALPPPYPGRPGPSHPGRRPPAGRGTGAHPTRQPGGPPRRTLKYQDQKLIPPDHQTRTSHP